MIDDHYFLFPFLLYIFLREKCYKISFQWKIEVSNMLTCIIPVVPSGKAQVIVVSRQPLSPVARVEAVGVGVPLVNVKLVSVHESHTPGVGVTLHEASTIVVITPF